MHTLVAVLHASPVGQSAAALQPQRVAMHCAPASPLTQLLHIVPAAPQAVAVSGDAHVVPLQQTPWHAWVVSHAVVHVWVVRSHALPAHPVVAVHPTFPSAASAASGPASIPASEGMTVASASVPVSGPESLASGGFTVESVPVSLPVSAACPSGATPSGEASSVTPESISVRSKLTTSSQPDAAATTAATITNTRKAARFRSVIPILHPQRERVQTSELRTGSRRPPRPHGASRSGTA